MTQTDPRRVYILGQIVDLLVAALGEPSCPVRRALVLTDVWGHPHSSLGGVMERLDIDKSTAFRDIDWLIDRGCIVKKPNPHDAREVSLQVVGHAKSNLENALTLAGGADYLIRILQGFMALSPERKQTLREAKILISLTTYGKLDNTSLSKALYNGPASTDQRALQNLVEEGLIHKDG